MRTRYRQSHPHAHYRAAARRDLPREFGGAALTEGLRITVDEVFDCCFDGKSKSERLLMASACIDYQETSEGPRQ